MRETSASEPLLTHRKPIRRRQNRRRAILPGSAWKYPAYCPCGVRCGGGVTLIRAFVRNVRTWPAMPRERMLWGGGEEIASIVADVNRWRAPNANAERI